MQNDPLQRQNSMDPATFEQPRCLYSMPASPTWISSLTAFHYHLYLQRHQPACHFDLPLMVFSLLSYASRWSFVYLVHVGIDISNQAESWACGANASQSSISYILVLQVRHLCCSSPFHLKAMCLRFAECFRVLRIHDVKSDGGGTCRRRSPGLCLSWRSKSIGIEWCQCIVYSFWQQSQCFCSSLFFRAAIVSW